MPQRCCQHPEADRAHGRCPVSRTIPLTRGYVAIVDDEDYERLSEWNWHVIGRAPYIYAVRKRRVGEGEFWRTKRVLYMHCAVVNADGDGLIRVDHFNHNTLDNRRANLRICTHGLNLANQRSTTGQSRFKGVHWRKDRHRWRARIRINRKDYSLGYYCHEEDAARAYDKAAIEAWGEFAYLNFP